VVTVRTPWFLNTETWTTRDGETIALEDMTPEHRENTLNFIGRRMHRYRDVIVLHYLFEAAWHDGGDAAQDALDAIAYHAETAPLEELMDSLPIVRRLRELNGIPLEREVDPEPEDTPHAEWLSEVVLGITLLGFAEWLDQKEEA
jgi:hypothetical protein